VKQVAGSDSPRQRSPFTRRSVEMCRSSKSLRADATVPADYATTTTTTHLDTDGKRRRRTASCIRMTADVDGRWRTCRRRRSLVDRGGPTEGRAIARRILVRYFEGALSLTLTLKVHRPTYTLPALTARVRGPCSRVLNRHYPGSWAVITGREHG